MLSRTEVLSLRGLLTTARHTQDGIRAMLGGLTDENRHAAASVFQSLHGTTGELARGLVLLIGGNPGNIGGQPSEFDRYTQTPREACVSEARGCLDRAKRGLHDALIGLPNVGLGQPGEHARAVWVSNAYGDITHVFQYRLSYADPLPAALPGKPILTLVAHHGNWQDAINGAFFALKYWSDWFGAWLTLLAREGDYGPYMVPMRRALMHQTNGVDAIFKALALASGLGPTDEDVAQDPMWRVGFALKEGEEAIPDRHHWNMEELAKLAPLLGGEPAYGVLLVKNTDAWLHIARRFNWKGWVFPNLATAPPGLRV